MVDYHIRQNERISILYLIASTNKTLVRWRCTCIGCPEQRECVPRHRVTIPRTAERGDQQRYGGRWSWSRWQLQRADDPSNHPYHRIRFIYRLAHCVLSALVGPVVGPLSAVRSALEQSVADRLRSRGG